MDQLIKSGKVQRGYFGVEPEDINAEMAELLRLPRNEGVVLKGVQRASPAGKAGLEPGDVMVSINGHPVLNSKGMLNLISQLPPGSDAQVKVVRAGKELDVQVPVGERPTPRVQPIPTGPGRLNTNQRGSLSRISRAFMTAAGSPPLAARVYQYKAR